jgi:hypothetical protein
MWLGWADSYPFIRMTHWQDGQFDPIREIPCAYRDSLHSSFYISKSFELSRDTAEYPVVAWTALSSYSGIETICACVPSDTGWSVADDLPGTDSGVLPSAARDMNGDAWIAYYKFTTTGIFWLHTYTEATTSKPQAAVNEDDLVVTWILSEPAPGSWWAVLRENSPDSFEPVARLQAGSSADMNWTDAGAGAGAYRYRIRRESVDKRYEWLSDPSDLPTISVDRTPFALSLEGLIPNPAVGSPLVGFTLANDSPAVLEVYSVSGRRVLDRQVGSLGAGRHVLDLRGQGVRPGVYWMRISQAGKVITKKGIVTSR